MRIFGILLLSIFVSCEEVDHPNSQFTVEIDIGRDGFICSAHEYKKNIYLTSAHCVPAKHRNKIYLDRNAKVAKEIIVHPQWDAQNVRYDLAIVKLGESDGFANFEIDEVFVLDEIESIVMQQGRKEVKKHRVEILQDDRFATKDIQGALCKGNSGSPAYFYDGQDYILVGIASGITKESGGCNNGGYSIFADLYGARDWIEENTY